MIGISSVKGPVTIISKDGRRSRSVVQGFSDTHTIHLDASSVALTEAFMLIDLSDTTNWTHALTGHINVEYIIIEIDPDATFLGRIRVGFLTNVDVTNGDYNDVFSIDLAKKSDLLVENIDFGSHGLDMETDHHFGPVDVNDTKFRTGLNIQGPDGATSYPSGNGDLVMIIERSAGEVDVAITIGYEAVT